MPEELVFRKRGKVEVKCERPKIRIFAGYKARELVVHSTLLSTYKKQTNIPDHLKFIVDPNRALDDRTYSIHDFLLAPLGFTEITQVGETQLVIVSKSKKSKNSDSNVIVTTKQSAVLQELTLKFLSREERDEWMKAVIAECDKNYLSGLLKSEKLNGFLELSGLLNSDNLNGFLEAAHEEIWSAILLGDEALRKAYTAPLGSDFYELARIVIKTVIDWMKQLLGYELQPKHKEIFTAFFSLMMQDTAARALLLLVRPDSLFLKDFQKDTAEGEYVFPDDKVPAKSEAEMKELQIRATALSFVDTVRLKVVQSPGWRKYRAFLSLVDHPAWPAQPLQDDVEQVLLPRSVWWCLRTAAAPDAAHDDCPEKQASPRAELTWMNKRVLIGPNDFSWSMFKSGIGDSPYLSYFFITQEIPENIDDMNVQKVLDLLKRLPPLLLSMTFAVDFVFKPLRQHFLSLEEYCKFRELWKVFYHDHTDNPELITNSWEKDFFDEVHKQLWAHIIMSPEPLFLQISTFFANAYNPAATAAFRSLAVDRLVHWVQNIMGRTELSVTDVPIFVRLLTVTASNPIVRAIFWMVLPANDALRGRVAEVERIQYMEQFIESMVSQSDLRYRQRGFLSFLTMCEHPLARLVAIEPADTASSASSGIAAVPLSITTIPLSWREETDWMAKYAHKGWLFSASELDLLQQFSPYFSLHILIRLYHEKTENWVPCVELMRALRPKSVLDERFQANVDFSDLQFVPRVTIGAHFHTFIESTRVVHIWHKISTPFLNAIPRFPEGARSQLVELFICSRSAPAEVTFGGIIPLLVRMELNSGSETRRILFETANHIDSATVNTPLPTVTDRHFADFKSFLDHLARWWVGAIRSEDQPLNELAGAAFAKFFLSCLDSALLRAICVIVEPSGLAPDSAVLSEFLALVVQHKENYYLLYLLQLLQYPGVQGAADDGTLKFSEPCWDDESKWIQNSSNFRKLDLDLTDLILLNKDPAYLLFRYLKNFFSRIDDSENVSRVIAIIEGMKPGSSARTFEARANYPSCALYDQAMIPDIAVHFTNMSNYCLFFQLWNILIPTIDARPSFSDAAMYATWLLVNSNVDSSISKLLLYPEADDQVNQSMALSYLKFIQRHAINIIKNMKGFVLPQLSFYAVPLPGDTVIDEEKLNSHHMLVNRGMRWTRCLISDQVEYAPLFAEILAAAIADVAMRSILATFIAAPSTITAFMKSTMYKAQYEFLDPVSPPPAVLLDAALQFIRLLARTFSSQEWRQYRSFMIVLGHPVVDAGSREEKESSWVSETAWIQERLQRKPEIVDWHEWELVLQNSPYILKLTVTKAFPPEKQESAMQRISAEHLEASFAAEHHNSAPVPHFIAMCLEEATQEFVLESFKKKNLINDKFCEDLLNVANCNQRLPDAFSILQSLVQTSDNSSPNSSWNTLMLERMPNISIVIIKFLNNIAQENLIRDEKLFGNLIMLVFQLESCNMGGASKSTVCTRASEWMRVHSHGKTMFFGMLTSLKFLKWLPKECTKLNFRPNFEQEGDQDGSNDASSVDRFNLSAIIYGYFSLCIEFQPEYFYEFVKSLSQGNGRPFFTSFLYTDTVLFNRILQFLARYLNLHTKLDLFKCLQERFIFYDDDHTNPAALQAIGLRNAKSGSICQNLTDEEFAALLTVAMYLHDTQNLSSRLENIVRSMIADQEKREMVAKFMKWMIEIFVHPDILIHIKRGPSEINHCKWPKCEKFLNVSFEDIIECAAEATKSSHVLRSAARSKSHDLLEQLFLHYIRSNDPIKWKELFRGSKNIAFFIKYVDAEDLNLAFKKFRERNPENYYFAQHLLRVRKLLKEPIVSAQDLLKLTSSGDNDIASASAFFEALVDKASRIPGDQYELRLATLLTASWMKISKEKMLFPLPPRNAQIITFLTVASWAKSLLGPEKDKHMGRALIAQVGTGEGKSLIIAMLAIFLVKWKNKRVHILENNPGLLEKDVKTMEPLYAEFGIKTYQEDPEQPTLSSASKDGRDGFARVGVTYCLRRNMEKYYQDSIMDMNVSGNPLKNTVLIVDEVDDLIVDDNPNQSFSFKDVQGAIFKDACEYLKNNDGNIKEGQENNIVWQLAKENGYDRAQKTELGKDYTVKEGEYYILLDGKPEKLYDYALEYLKYSLHNQPPVFMSNYYYQSIPYMLSQYDCITGFSGSVGSKAERNFLTDQYKAWCFNAPSFLDTCRNVAKSPPNLMSDEALSNNKPCVHVYRMIDEQVEKVIELCIKLHSKVPVLVIAKSEVEAVYLRDKLKAFMTRSAPDSSPDCIQLFLEYKVGTMTLDKNNWGAMVDKATTRHNERGPFYITVTDPFGGRGHDFDVHDDEVNRLKGLGGLGGLAVIMTSIPPSEREWIQRIGRTARKDNAGQYAVVLCSSDESFPMRTMPELLREDAMVDENDRAIPNIYNESLIGKLLAIRDEGQQDKLVLMTKSIATGRRLNRLCDQFYLAYGAMDAQMWPKGGQVILRDLLSNKEEYIIPEEIDDAFRTFDVKEHDATMNDFEVPNVNNRSYWNEEDQAEWDSCFEEVEDTKIKPVQNPLRPNRPSQQSYPRRVVRGELCSERLWCFVWGASAYKQGRSYSPISRNTATTAAATQ